MRPATELSGSLQGRCVLVFGAGSPPGETVAPSNGAACAIAYSRAGASVACVDIDGQRAEDIAGLIRSEGGKALAITADATSDNDVQRAVAEAAASLGGLDILHNNVGFGGHLGAPDVTSVAQFDREIDVTLKSAFLGIRYAVPLFRANGGGVITNISSGAAVRFLRVPMVAYSAAKAGVEALTRACASAYGRDNIRVNCLRLGIIETPLVLQGMTARGFDALRAEVEMNKSRAKVPLRGEHGRSWDVAEAAVFMASDAARYISGAILNVDGALDCAPH